MAQLVRVNVAEPRIKRASLDHLADAGVGKPSAPGEPQPRLFCRQMARSSTDVHVERTRRFCTKRNGPDASTLAAHEQVGAVEIDFARRTVDNMPAKTA